MPGSVPGPGRLMPEAGVPPAPVAMGEAPLTPPTYSYNPSSRRDPFSAIVKDGKPGGEQQTKLPPLQRLMLTELSLIGIVWGGFGYTAMVEAPDGRRFTLREGTRIGPNNGVVSSITDKAVVVQERYMDVYGNKQVRQYVKHLHPKEGTE